MGIYIKGEKIPSNCLACRHEMSVNCDIANGLYGASEYVDRRYERCPLVEVVEPHGDLIDITNIKTIEIDGASAWVHWEQGSELVCDIEAPIVIEREGE